MKYLPLILLSLSLAGADTLLNTTIYARQINQVRIALDKPCSPCALWWHAEGQGDTLIVNLYGIDTVKVQYDFQHFNATNNSLRLYQGGKLRSTMPFTMDYPIPESIAHPPTLGESARAVRVGKDGNSYNILGRPFVAGWMVK